MEIPIFSYTPTGVLYKTAAEAKEAEECGMYLQVDSDGLVSQSKPVDTRILKPKKGWSQSNEPEEHLDQVAKDLYMELSEVHSTILLFSYKDTSLLKRITTKKRVSADYVYKYSTPSLNCVCPEDEKSEEVASRIASRQCKYDLIICRHYLEHYQDPLVIMEAMIQKLSENGRIYIEVPDCSIFLKRRNPLFMWEQHKQYFTKTSLVLMMNQVNLDCRTKLYGESIEPSICCIMRKDESMRHQINQKKKTIWKIERGIIDEYVEIWRSYLQTSKRRKILLGIGHNSDRFMQITRSEKLFDSLIDYDQTKTGMYIGKSKQAIVNKVEASRDEYIDIILGVHDRSFGQVRRKLSEQYTNARIWSIFSMYES